MHISQTNISDFEMANNKKNSYVHNQFYLKIGIKWLSAVHNDSVKNKWFHWGGRKLERTRKNWTMHKFRIFLGPPELKSQGHQITKTLGKEKYLQGETGGKWSEVTGQQLARNLREEKISNGRWAVSTCSPEVNSKCRLISVRKIYVTF